MNNQMYPRYAVQQPYGYQQYQQPTVQPNYGYQMPLNNMQVQQPRAQGIQGRIINSPDEIVPAEVDMNGGWTFFPTADHTAVYAKVWSQDGSRIITYKFIPEVDQNSDDSQVSPFDSLNDKIDRVIEMMKSISE